MQDKKNKLINILHKKFFPHLFSKAAGNIVSTKTLLKDTDLVRFFYSTVKYHPKIPMDSMNKIFIARKDILDILNSFDFEIQCIDLPDIKNLKESLHNVLKEKYNYKDKTRDKQNFEHYKAIDAIRFFAKIIHQTIGIETYVKEYEEVLEKILIVDRIMRDKLNENKHDDVIESLEKMKNNIDKLSKIVD